MWRNSPQKKFSTIVRILEKIKLNIEISKYFRWGKLENNFLFNRYNAVSEIIKTPINISSRLKIIS
jgi:hypothetical protein